MTEDALLTLPPPRLSSDALSRHLARGWGLSGRLTPLTSERDLNHRLDTDRGRYVLRLTNPAEPEAMTDFQTRAHLHVAARDPELPIQHLIPTQGGAPWLALPEGRLRLFTWAPGQVLAEAPRSPAQTRALGVALARLTAALADFTHPAADHVLLWDIRRLPHLADKAAAIADPDLRAEAAAFIADYAARIAPRLAALPTQVVHADFNPHNLLVDPAAPETVTGILDFGDMVLTPRACDLAVAASYHLGRARSAGPPGGHGAGLCGPPAADPRRTGPAARADRRAHGHHPGDPVLARHALPRQRPLHPAQRAGRPCRPCRLPRPRPRRRGRHHRPRRRAGVTA
jgi:hydroxylysine kinase